MKLEDAKYKCEVCGNITYKPNRMQISIMPYGEEKKSTYERIRHTKMYDICEQCTGANIAGTFINFFKKLWRKK